MSLHHYMAISHIADPGGVSEQQLSEILCVITNNIVLLLNELKEAGLTRRVRDPADHRRHMVEITNEGSSARWASAPLPPPVRDSGRGCSVLGSTRVRE